MLKLVLLSLSVFEFQIFVSAGFYEKSRNPIGSIPVVGEILDPDKGKEYEYNDAINLEYQRAVLILMAKLGQPLSDYELQEACEKWDPAEHQDRFKNKTAVVLLSDLVKRGEITPNTINFSIFDLDQLAEMVLLFEVLYYALDWDTFVNTGCWARVKFNSRIFIWAFRVALFTRKDSYGVIMPGNYEVNPYFFVNGTIIRELCKDQLYLGSESYGYGRTGKVVFPIEFSGTSFNDFRRVAYFLENPSLHRWYADYQMKNPFWWKKQYPERDRKGEKFCYVNHEILYRYNAELSSNDLHEAWPLTLDRELVGFKTDIEYPNGQCFPARPDGLTLQMVRGLPTTKLQQYIDRCGSAIASNFFINTDLTVVRIDNPYGIDIVGAALEASRFSVNPTLYGSIFSMFCILISRRPDPWNQYGMPPGVNEHYFTMLRDPATFNAIATVDRMCKDHKDNLIPYNWEELTAKGVKICNVTVSNYNTIKTFTEPFEFSLKNALLGYDEYDNFDPWASIPRVNHESFTTTIEYKNEDKGKWVVARMYMVPKYNSFDVSLELDELRWRFFLIDAFIIYLKSGSGEYSFTRNSDDSSVITEDPPSFVDLEDQVDDGTFKNDYRFKPARLPRNLNIPKGKYCGMKFTLFVVMTDVHKDYDHNAHYEHYGYDKGTNDGYDSVLDCCGWDHYVQDDKPFGFPLDRRIPNTDMFYKNPSMWFTTIKVKFMGKEIC